MRRTRMWIGTGVNVSHRAGFRIPQQTSLAVYFLQTTIQLFVYNISTCKLNKQLVKVYFRLA
jgi:hypothetical protein